MMTRKHFETIAATLNANLAPLALVEDLADDFAEENPNFSRSRFITAATEQLDQRLRSDVRALDRALKSN